MNVAFALVILVALATCIALTVQAPLHGVCWKVPYANIPELQEIYQAFRDSCVAPQIPNEWYEAAKHNSTFQSMRLEAQTLPQESEAKYEVFETKPKRESEWALGLREFYGNRFAVTQTTDSETLFARRPKDLQNECNAERRVEEYVPRGGCFYRHVSSDLERLARDKIQALMARWNLPNDFKRLSDSRGATWSPAGGFMEMHSNRKHFAGWRLYFHYLPEKDEGFFVYKHPYDHTVRTVRDSNEACNMFRIRRPPNALLWHAIWNDSPRFSWGIYIPPELAQKLKKCATCY